MVFKILFIFFGFIQFVHANEIVVNETLFELNQEIWTSYDLKQFIKAKNKTPLKLDFLNTASDDKELFLATRLLYYQTLDSMGSAELIKFKASDLTGQLALQLQPSNLSNQLNKSTKSEILIIKLLNDITDVKYKTSTTSEKFLTWLSYMKKKYNFINQK